MAEPSAVTGRTHESDLSSAANQPGTSPTEPRTDWLGSPTQIQKTVLLKEEEPPPPKYYSASRCLPMTASRAHSASDLQLRMSHVPEALRACLSALSEAQRAEVLTFFAGDASDHSGAREFVLQVETDSEFVQVLKLNFDTRAWKRVRRRATKS